MADKKRSGIQDVFKREGDRLRSFIRRQVTSAEDAEDILQDVFFQLSDTDDWFESIERVGSWLFTVARNKVIDLYRKKKPESIKYIKGEKDDDPINPADLLFDESTNPEQIYTHARVWEELERALDELPEEQKEIFIKHELEDKSFKEISDVTGIPINTLISRKRYAVVYLRERLQELYLEFIN
ncbi:MAG: RNA polymerase sigma factor [Bacteroidetes bacterium]|nr:RNA polymerase sigma factor [Bacteroidota bacterium]